MAIHIKYLLLSICAVFVFGCQGIDKPKKPKNLIPKDKMTDVLYDLHIVNAAKSVNKNVLEVHGINPEKFIFEKHKIDSLQFAQSNDYYAYDTKAYKSIVTKVKERMEKEKVLYDALAEKEKKEQNPEKPKPQKDTAKINRTELLKELKAKQ